MKLDRSDIESCFEGNTYYTDSTLIKGGKFLIDGGIKLRKDKFREIYDISQTYGKQVAESKSPQFLRQRKINPEKYFRDAARGKVGEFFATYFLALYFKESEIWTPDISIRKSMTEQVFDADLKYENIDFHVKSDSRWDQLCWVFERKDLSIIRRKTSNDRFIGVQFDDEDNLAHISIVCQMAWILQNMGEMKLERLRNIKQCLYFDDIRNALLP